MPFDCQHRQRFGQQACLDDCLATRPPARFEFARVERGGDAPPADVRSVDVAILDMHHGWPNLGHAAIVHAVQNAVCDLRPDLDTADLRVRVISYDVRRGHRIPEGPGGRHGLYIGTGGPGHLDPRMNDGVSEGSQGIDEDPRWEAPLFELFDRIQADASAALFGICHTFGVMCRWRGVAEAVLRGLDKGGKSAGIVENELTSQATEHPWFARLAEEAPDHRHIRVLDNRLFDLLPTSDLDRTSLPLGYECRVPGATSHAVTMIEFARDSGGVMPRVFGVNHHPEIVNRPRLLTILLQKRDRGEVDERDAWFEERRRTLVEPIADEHGDRLLHLAASYTFLGPVRFYLYRLVRERAEALGHRLLVDEEHSPIAFSLRHDAMPLTR
jgi:hypothetical protein